MDMAERFAKTSEATRLKVGAIALTQSGMVLHGVNGQPSGWPTEVCEDDDNTTLPTVRHAEKAALDKLRRSPETSAGSTFFISHAPCLNCSIEMVDAGVKKVYYRHPYRLTDGIEYLKSKGVEVEQV